jgi:CRISPR/Cas system CSM-associated protein Csm4 (group 5 of RAMP superfamily)
VNIDDVEHYKHFFRDHNNLVILKKEKKEKKIFFFPQHFKNVIVTSKVKGEGNKVVSIVKSYSNRASQRKHQTFKKQRHQTQIQVSSAILQDQVTFFNINFTNLI